MRYCIRNAAVSDIDAIMHIERASFAASVMESEAVFADRLRTAAPYNFVLCVPKHCDSESQPAESTSAESSFSEGKRAAGVPECRAETPREWGSGEFDGSHGGYTAAGYLCAERWNRTAFSAQDFALGHSAADRHCPTGAVLYISSFALAPELRGKKISVQDRYTVLNASPRGAAGLETAHLDLGAAELDTDDARVNSTGAGSGESFDKQAAAPSAPESLARFFFRTVLDTITDANPDIERIVLLVNENWTAALRIYESQGFHRTGVLHRFAGFSGSSAYIYEKSFKQDAHHGL